VVAFVGLFSPSPAQALGPHNFAVPRSANQLIVVSSRDYDPPGYLATFRTFQRANASSPWKPVFAPWRAEIGSGDFVDVRHFGDHATPTGVFKIGLRMYGIKPNPGRLHYAYHQLVCGDWWDEDPYSPEYNRLVHVPCGTTPPFAAWSEALWTESRAYPYLAVLNTNNDPTIGGAGAPGAGIFLHHWMNAPTQGCVALPLADLMAVLRWLRPAEHPVIEMGTDAEVGDLARAPRRARTSAAPSKVGIASSSYLASDPKRLSGIGASWAYNWSAMTPARDPHLDWVPMTWGARSITPAVLSSLRRATRSGEAQDLLGFNEPDSASQADMTPLQAATLWPTLEKTGLRLGSPAPAVPTDGWLAQFMKLARQRHLRVDFVALHYYQDFTNPDAVAQLRTQLVAIHNLYHKPIWITEIGALDIRTFGEPMLHPPTAARAVSYMRKLFSMLNALPFVERYAWFTDGCWNDAACRTSSLVNGSGRLTQAGHEFEAIAR
jgi:L,D-peptidoglycan transpeptidase YkuD (ErfK/YbiS/YcfS/YnhG family)